MRERHRQADRLRKGETGGTAGGNRPTKLTLLVEVQRSVYTVTRESTGNLAK